MIRCLLLVISICCSTTALASQAVLDAIPAYAHWHEVSSKTDVPVNVLYGMALAESGKTTKSKRYVPWAFAIGVGVDEVNKRHYAIYPETREAAVQKLRELRAKGHRNLGLGMMQINIKANGFRVDDIEELFDAEFNLQIAAQVIRECSKKNTFETMLSCYSHGLYSSPGGKLYAAKVVKFANKYGNPFHKVDYWYGELSYESLLAFSDGSTEPLESQRKEIEIVE